ncbi:MAG: aminoglycoside phosphotransferase family protein [Betaproteobacteria bacterium]|nr:aminoglycoside phosphotransferase family protein [Betaproteobacteria bacterium]MDH5220276.1 aminoglycoside phosphotransferase family protein [Betaproteobacteria bacterium]MDH5352645.1 aminoglycoside phosphotransferase family protein [Betaproteobacteria bacterium]
MSGSLPEPVLAFLRAAGLMRPGEVPTASALTGGVSSDIWMVELSSGPVCVKRALPRLRVAQLWEAPIERNRYEWRWMQAAARIAPGSAPRVLAHDDSGVFAMEYLDGARHPLWKSELRAGRADARFAARVGDTLARIHAATAGDAAVAAAFATDAGFHAIRLEPYLLATARRHPDLAPQLHALAERTAATRAALVHGDVSPKNILVGEHGPVFLDAECAWYGDPAFDLAFCLNHLLLKCLWVPAGAPEFLRCFDALAGAYLRAHAPAGLEARAASLLPGLLLARVDGKSPVEYLTEEAQRERVRAIARPLLEHPVDTLGAVRAAWQES